MHEYAVNEHTHTHVQSENGIGGHISIHENQH